jgi:hypothetical protein
MLRAEKQEDLYKILGITKKADQSEVKTVFRKLALKWHPDKNDSPEAKETFQKISMAYSSKPFSPPQKKNLSSTHKPPPKKPPSILFPPQNPSPSSPHIYLPPKPQSPQPQKFPIKAPKDAIKSTVQTLHLGANFPFFSSFQLANF